MLEHIKTGLAWMLGIFVIILLLPIILIVVSCFAISALWRRMFRALRHDPKLKLEQIVPEPAETEETAEYAEKYFAAVIEEIAKKSSGKVKNLQTEFSEWNNEEDGSYRSRTITYQKQVSTKHATIVFKLQIEEVDRHGELVYYSYADGDDAAQAGHIAASIKPSHLSRKLFDVVINYDHEAAYFCIAILCGNGRYNQQAEQLWARLADRDVWVVKYKDEASSDFGVRSSYGTGRAREYWFDS